MSTMATADGLPMFGFSAKVPETETGTGTGTGTETETEQTAPGPPVREAGDRTANAPSRFSLRLSAGMWRTLQNIGMSLHFLAPPRPPNPAFSRSIPSTLSPKKGNFTLQFYTPARYQQDKKQGRRFPAVVNFHGGGFTLGSGTDDARFARYVLDTCEAVFVSVEYRLAPEYPFPTAVEDGADALLYLVREADDFAIDPRKMATSGFSAGGNLAMTAPMLLSTRIREKSLRNDDACPAPAPVPAPVPAHRILGVVTWYPITDYTIARAERRAGCVRPDQTLAPMLTNLFDAAYLYPADVDLADPYLSPSQASDELLAEAMPPNVIFYTCEWDMLHREGEDLARRLEKPPIGKTVRYRMIDSVPHGWDKGPDPRRPPPRTDELYRECCLALQEIFERGS